MHQLYALTNAVFTVSGIQATNYSCAAAGIFLLLSTFLSPDLFCGSSLVTVLSVYLL